MLYAGIDIGSQSTDVVIIDEEKKIKGYSVISTGAIHKNAAESALAIACSNANCNVDDIKYVVGTGYGRKNISIASSQVTEITCHAKGAFYLNNDTRMILDIGGQDSKVIKIDNLGNVVDFIMNEKCAAGTGRFLETMARILEVDLSEMGEKGIQSEKDVKLSSICTVFAESEVISKIAEGDKCEDIINGIHNTICDRAIGMIQRLSLEAVLTMTGGVAKNRGVVRNLSERLGISVFVPEEPQIVGALGAAVIAYEKSNRR
ncbi:acyl-CoA dehydratase activase [Cellulosilyticum ruminicola]|uniref:acyl-CoA dehydratase activase n=1 Tax=Cellulosilyticum ruminicola TaxID=425254 RepID=UPI0006CFBE40|nr:acyl-CoA dehydratase activase [Cellulosilyticum ruminicola]